MVTKQILGLWKVDPEDFKSIESYGDTVIEFNDTGKLKYVTKYEGKEEVIYLTYEINGNKLITNQPSSPRKEETEFEITSDGRLKLNFSGEESFWVR